MTRATLLLSDRTRARAHKWVDAAPDGTICEFRENKRSTEQNSAMWAALTDVSMQLKWHGQDLSPDDWKMIFVSALHEETRIVPNLNGTGFIDLGTSSSSLTKQEFSDLLELIFEFGARHGVDFYGEAADASVSAAPTTESVVSPPMEDECTA